MWAYRVKQCEDTKIHDACFSDVQNGGRGNTQYRGNRGSRGNRTSGSAQNGRRLENDEYDGLSFEDAVASPIHARRQLQGRGRRVCEPPANCSATCYRALRTAESRGCMETPELLGRTLMMITPEQWRTFHQVCSCQNARRLRPGQKADKDHLACCKSITGSLKHVQKVREPIHVIIICHGCQMPWLFRRFPCKLTGLPFSAGGQQQPEVHKS